MNTNINTNTFSNEVFEKNESKLEKLILEITKSRKINKISDDNLINIVFESHSFLIYSIVGANERIITYKSSELATSYLPIGDAIYSFLEVNGDIFLIDTKFSQLFEKRKKQIRDERKENFLKSVGLK